MGACTADDEEAYAALRGYMDTFMITGPVDTTFRLYSNQELGFKFLYSADYIQEEPAIVNVKFDGPVISCVALYPFAGDETQFVEVENVSTIAATAQEASNFFYNTHINLGAALNEPYIDTWGGVEWTSGKEHYNLLPLHSVQQRSMGRYMSLPAGFRNQM